MRAARANERKSFAPKPNPQATPVRVGRIADLRGGFSLKRNPIIISALASARRVTPVRLPATSFVGLDLASTLEFDVARSRGFCVSAQAPTPGVDARSR